MFQFITQHQSCAAVAIYWFLIVSLLLSLTACAAHYAVHPGALNQTDSAAYDSLLVAETAIDQARLDSKAGNLPEGSNRALNTLIESYNVARNSWLTYRGAIATKTAPDDYFTQLTKNLANLTAAIQKLKESQ